MKYSRRLRLFSGDYFGNDRHVKALFVGDAGPGKVNVNLVLLVF